MTAAATTTIAPPQSWPPDAETVRCPHGLFASLRAQAPVYRYPHPGVDGAPFYLVTGHAEACAVLMRPTLFRNNLRADEASPEPILLPDRPRFYRDPSIFFTDGSDHSAKRAWAIRFLDRARLAEHAPLIRASVDRHIDAFADAGHCDFRAQFCDLMPISVVREAMGLPPQADAAIRRMSDAIPPIDNNPDATPAQIAEFEAATLAMLTLCADLVQSRFEQPTADFVSQMVGLQVARDGALDPNTLAKQVMVMIFGADHAMGGHIADLMAWIGRDPALQARLRADRSLIWPFAQEVLRHTNTVPWLFRRCVSEAQVGDVLIPAGATVLVATAAANYDPAVFPEPEQLNIDRPNVEREHLALGRGAHRCVGSPMARLQVEITVNRMLDRFENIRLDEARSALEPGYSLGFRVAKAVWLRWKVATKQML